jgi:oligosaccharyl transferase (archaeosortase A-associated)
MIFKKVPSWIVALILLIIIVAVALWLRVLLPYSQVFVGDWVKMTGVDAYYYMRLVDNLMRHFPQLTQFDPYNIYPGGALTDAQPNFFAYFMGGVIWLLGIGSPGQHFADTVAVYIPPVMAVITILAVFIIGRALVNRWVGLLAAAMLAIMPGEFLNRSLFGYTDQHIAEVMWSTLTIMFLMLAIKHGKSIDQIYLKQNGWRVTIKPAILSGLAGLALGLYMLTWAGAALFLLIIFAFLLVQAVIDYMSARDVVGVAGCGLIVFIAGLAVYLPGGVSQFTLLSLVGGIGLTIVLIIAARLVEKYVAKRIYYPIILIVLGLLGGLALYLIAPATFASLFERLAGIFTWPSSTTIMEMQPLLLQQGSFTLQVALGNYTSGFFLGLAGLVLIIYRVIRKPEPLGILLLIWSVIILLAALAMRRFSYYLAVNMAVMSGYFAWWVLSLAGFGRQVAQVPVPAKQVTSKKKISKRREAQAARKQKGNYVLMTVTLVIVLAVVIFPNLGPLPGGVKPAQDLATRPLFAPPDAWCESLDWLRVNTPEPLGNADAYYGLYKPPGSPGGYVYPGTAYGVMAWWDYGYWITRIGRRIPFSNPGTAGTKGESKFFLAQDEAAAGQAIKDLNIKYIIVDKEIASYDGKFHALPTWVGGVYQEYYDLYLQKQANNYAPVLLFYPEFYRSMVIRLYNFDGKEVTPNQVEVIRYEPVKFPEGKTYNVIADTKKFDTYAEADSFLKSQESGSYRIVGRDTYQSPVPLEALKGYKLVHGSLEKASAGTASVSFIKIYEHQP